ncbi:MAG TPA: Yip1 family protein [Rhodanobacteraceae bacterium]
MSLQTRVQAILTRPAEEWRIIAAEPADVAGLLRDYAAPLAAIPAVCRFIGFTLIGVSVPLLGTYRTGIVSGFVGAVVSWVMALVGAWIAAVIVEKLAPTFQSRGDTVQAMKLVVYAMTPVWVAGVLNIIPALSVLVLLAALYAIYLFYLGLPVLMNTPSNQVIPYMVVAAVVVIIVSFVLGLVAAAISGVGGYRTF